MKCALADKGCVGRLEWHHVVSQSRLKREFPYGAYCDGSVWVPIPRQVLGVEPSTWLTIARDNILGDPRNRVWACSFHHEKITNARVDVPLPESVWEFAREFGLAAMLENDLARRSAA